MAKAKINTLEFNRDACNNCGMCITVCPHGVFAEDGRAVRLADPDACMECGACALNCSQEAIEVDSGVGCASAMIMAALTGREEVTCGCDGCC